MRQGTWTVWWVMPDLSSNSRRTLLSLARLALQSHWEGGGAEKENVSSLAGRSPELLMKRGCFVTLKEHGALRGCIGTFQADKPLFENVMRMAVSAGFQDPRFPPLSRGELEQVHIEISVLGDLRKMNSMEELEMGRHGVWIQCGLKSGTFLPEVATEQGWSREEFIRRCAAEKAGLNAEEFSHAEISLYEVTKIKEGE